jgi:hypothetical protein
MNFFQNLPWAASLVDWVSLGSSVLGAAALGTAALLMAFRLSSFGSSLSKLQEQVGQLKALPPQTADARTRVDDAIAEKPPADDVIKGMKARLDELRSDIVLIVEALAAQRRSEFDVMLRSESTRREELLRSYYVAQQQFSALITPLLDMQVPVRQMLPCATNPPLSTLAQALAERYQALCAPIAQVEARIDELNAASVNPAAAIDEFTEQLRSGALEPGDCMARIQAIQTPPPHQWPDVVAERSRLQSDADSFLDDFLAWVDQIAELRAVARETGEPRLVTAATRVVEAAATAAKNWQIDIEDVLVGVARFDERQHELVNTIPRSDIAPETVIGVSRLGCRRNGKLLRKPQVIVAAAR